MKERENYFSILDLSEYPPESDIMVIKNRVKEKQREWSKLRNHPIKGREAQQKLELLKDIKNVISSPNLLTKERKLAATQYIKRKKDQIAKLDKKIALLSSKGKVTEKEIEIIISQFSNFTPESIKKRVKVPIVKDSIKDKGDKLKIAVSTLKKIDSLLKIVDQEDLYQFLSIDRDDSVDKILSIIDQLYITNNKVATKNALITAKSELLGYCKTIFNSKERIRQYSEHVFSKKMLPIIELLDTAGINGEIEENELKYILNESEEIGLDQKDVLIFIKKYCKNKRWYLEIPNNLNKKDNSNQNRNLDNRVIKESIDEKTDPIIDINSIGMKKMERFLPYLKVASSDGKIQLTEFNYIIKEAQKEFVNRDIAIKFVLNYCKKYNLKYEIPEDEFENIEIKNYFNPIKGEKKDKNSPKNIDNDIMKILFQILTLAIMVVVTWFLSKDIMITSISGVIAAIIYIIFSK